MQFVGLYIVRRNTREYNRLQKVLVNTLQAVVECTQWRVPVSVDGVHTGFKYVADGPKPSDDSVKVLRIKDVQNNELYYAAIPDASTAQAYADAVNSSAASPVSMPAVSLPVIYSEEAAVKDSNGNYVYFTYTQALAAAQVYVLSGSKNGKALPAAPDAGFADLASLKTWADSNWNTSYTMTVAGTKVTITANDATSGSVSVTVRNYYESAAPTAISAGHHYTLDAVVDGVALPQIVGADNGALSTLAAAANANPDWAQYGRYSVVSSKVRLVAYSEVGTASLTATYI
jgi:hypothetical protein